MSFDYDLIVIGAGSGGVRLSRMAANKGWKVAAVEERYLGGTCVNVGCVPKKLFVYASEYPAKFSQAKNYGLNRSEEHTSELQSRPHLVCRLLLEKKKK